MTILEKIKFEEEWLSEVNLTKENIKIAFAGIRATVLEQQSCSDCISREAVEKITWDEPYSRDYLNVLTELRDRVRALPSVQPQRPKGKWIATENEEMNIVGYYCSGCDLPMETEEKTAFCPNCGADMRESEAE